MNFDFLNWDVINKIDVEKFKKITPYPYFNVSKMLFEDSFNRLILIYQTSISLEKIIIKKDMEGKSHTINMF